jgi:hypothetical protein
MNNGSFRITEEKYKGGLKGPAFLIDMESLRGEFDYIGLWYAKDGSEKTFITTEIYYSESDDKPFKPDEFDTEIKENSFKQVNRIELSRSNKKIWIASKIDNGSYCSFKTGAVKQSKLYINYKVIHNKSFGFDIINKGLMKGGSVQFFDLLSIYKSGSIELNQALLFLVMIKDIPPADWNIDDAYYGVENLPVFTPIFKFSDGKSYSEWFGQKPF